MLKELIEKREELQESMKNLLNTAKDESRALNEEEITKFDEMENELKNINATIEREERLSQEENREIKKGEAEKTQEERDYDAFAEFIRANANGTEMRSDVAQMTKGDNGAVIPTSIVNKIWEKIEEISPLYRMATHYNAKGNLQIPKEDTTTDSITVAYAAEFAELDSHSNKFATIELKGFLYGALTKISKSLLNNSNFNLVNWVINKMAKKAAKFIEGEMLNGTPASGDDPAKVLGIAGSYDSTNMKVTLASKTAITAEELIDIQDKVIDAHQANACWIMSRSTRNKIRKLKDGNGVFLLERDFFKQGEYMLLGKPIHVSENCSDLGTSKNAIFYGDFSGVAVKEPETAEVQVLREKYATQHAIGVVLWGELDAKVEDTQKIAVAVCPA